MQSISFKASLVPLENPASPISLDAEVAVSGTRLQVTYTLESSLLAQSGLDAFAWEEGSARFCETLWKKTCFEIFLAHAETGQYWEWNFSARERWGAFSFRDTRVRNPLEARRDAGAPQIGVDGSQLTQGRLCLVATLDMSFSTALGWSASTGRFTKDYLCSLNAITETSSGERVHWALRHLASGKADFHTFENFVSLENY